MGSCSGIICNAGFQLASEALHLGKKLLVIPMKGQFEQICNAEALKELGADIITDVNNDFGENLREWTKKQSTVKRMDYPDIVPVIANRILSYIH